MKNFLALFVLATSAINTAVAAPNWGLFVADYETDVSPSQREDGTIVDRLRQDKRFTRFVDVLERERGLRDELENREKETTVFAPTNEAFKRFDEEWGGDERGKNDRDEDRQTKLRELIRYHIAPDTAIEGDSLHAGTLIPTNLRLRELDDRHQRVRVFRFHGDVWLNMRARIVEKDVEADNGRIHAIDRVLIPPREVTEMMYTLPTEFSTFLSALERTQLVNKVDRERGVTVFAPSNRAWLDLGFDNLRYLFSCAGQKEEREREGRNGREGHRTTCRGVQELKKIVQYHIATELAWTTDLMEKKETRLKTLEGKEIEITTRRSSRGRDEEDQNKDVRQYNFVVNQGEARVTFTDGLARNGVIQILDSVLIPHDVKLPHDRYQ